jgi:hypothetical protein
VLYVKCQQSYTLLYEANGLFLFIIYYVKIKVRLMSENEMINLLQKISEDIAMVKNYAKIQTFEAMSAILRKIASTPERQQMWRLADGNNSNEEIASRIGVVLRSVQYFVQEAQDAGLIIMKRRGYPSRIMDIFPSEWRTWKPKVAEGEKQKTSQELTIKEDKSDAEG